MLLKSTLTRARNKEKILQTICQMPQRKLFDRNTKQRKRKKLDAANFN
jgi:hypothetical protein